MTADDFERARDRAVGVLREGKLVVMPTDTVYAVVADAFDAQATQRVFGAKRRGRQVPLGVVIHSPRQLSGLVTEVPDCAERLMASYWPGPLTLVFKQSEGLVWDLGENRGTVGVRLSAHELLTAVVHEVGPLVCTAAWVGYGPQPHTVEDAKSQLGDLVSLYIDGGRCDAAVSTIVDVTRGRCEILRSGVIPDRHVEMVATGQVAWGRQPQSGDLQDKGA